MHLPYTTVYTCPFCGWEYEEDGAVIGSEAGAAIGAVRISDALRVLMLRRARRTEAALQAHLDSHVEEMSSATWAM